MATLALRSSLPGTGSIFDDGFQVPDDPMARGSLGVATLKGVEADFEAAVKQATQKSSIADVYGLLVGQGIDALIDRLAQQGVARDAARAALSTIEDLISKAGSYQLLPAGSAQQFYVTEAGDILNHPHEDPLADNGAKIDRLHQLALALVAPSVDPIEGLPPKTRERLLTALQTLKDAVLTVQTEGKKESKESRPNLAIPDNADWVSDEVNVEISGRLEKVQVDLDISHTYIGDLTVELVAPDRSSIVLHDKKGGAARDIEKTFTLDSEGMRALEGKEVNGRWRIRIRDSADRDVGTLNSWKLSVETRGSTHSSDLYGEARKKALYAGAGAIGRRLATIGLPDIKSRAYALTADLVKTCPYWDVRSILIAGLNGSRDSLVAADRTKLDKELIPLVAPETPDYDTIFRIRYENGRPIAEKRSLNFACMFGSEDDDLIYNGGIEMIQGQGFAEQESDKAGYRLFTKKVNQDDPNAVCQEIKTYVGRMNGRNMLAAMGDPDIDVIQYDGHSNLGRNIENSLAAAPELAGSKILALGACATSDRAFLIRNKFNDPKRVQLINTYESTYFNWTERDGKKVMNYSENMMLMFGLQTAMSDLKPWKGDDGIASVLKQATHSWSHSKDVNYTNPGLLEQLLLWDLDQNGLPDGLQHVWDGGRIKPAELVEAEFKATEPNVPVAKLDATKVFHGVQSLDTFGRYNPITRAAYQVRTIRSRGFVDLGREGPMVQIGKTPQGGWSVAVNSWYSHASLEALRAAMHYEFISAVMKERSNDPQIRRLSHGDKNVMKLLFAGASLEYDNAWRDDRVWESLMTKYNYPPGIDYHEVSSVLHWEHEQPRDELAGNFRNIAMVKEKIGAELAQKIEAANVG
jgi:subtilisin-like proprotein convertase family protein